jgi:hypothetical protein
VDAVAYVGDTLGAVTQLEIGEVMQRHHHQVLAQRRWVRSGQMPVCTGCRGCRTGAWSVGPGTQQRLTLCEVRTQGSCRTMIRSSTASRSRTIIPNGGWGYMQSSKRFHN